MSDFTSSFWDWYIGVLTLVSIVACGVLLKVMSIRRAPGSGVDMTGHTWDEDLGEYNNPLPRWWIWLFYITIVFSIVYLALYPGLGSWTGYWNWTSTGQYEAESRRAEEQYGPLFERFSGQDVKVLAMDPEARAIGQKLFLNHCAQCHASDARGSRGFPNLADRDWLWGGDPEAIRVSIADGRTGVMPPLGAVLGEEGAKDAAHYVRSLSGLTSDPLRVARGKEKYAANCAACHGPAGKGNPALGAPNLTDGIWLYGSGEQAIIETITRGRNNQMPAHKDFLSASKIHLLTAYVWGISNGAEGASR